MTLCGKLGFRESYSENTVIVSSLKANIASSSQEIFHFY